MRRSRRWGRAAAVVAAALVTGGLASVAALAPRAAAATVSVSVSGNHLVDGSGNTIRLLGVDRSGSEYMCTANGGIFDGPTDSAAIAAIASWHTNVVRVPLNEDCWLGINGVNPAYSGANYRSAIGGFVSALHQAGLAVILEVHVNAPGTNLSTDQQVMLDADHGPAFWSSVASYFKTDPGVVFDLYNEPHDISWDCWLNGCAQTTLDVEDSQGHIKTINYSWQTAGMQSLVNAVRSTGATQVIMLGGIGWSGDLSGWPAHKPTDSLNQLAASFHTYNFNPCSPMPDGTTAQQCWDANVAPVAQQVPVITGEIGEDDCAHAYIDQYMAWADAHGISYLGWTWDTGGGWTCTGGPTLITDYNGTPTGMGIGLRDHLAALASGTTTTTSGTGTTTTTAASGNNGTLAGQVRKGKRRGLAGATVTVSGTAVATTTSGGQFSVTEAPGSFTESVTVPNRVCHADSLKGPTSTTVTVTAGNATNVTWFCRRK